jgi:hypothetical protein
MNATEIGAGAATRLWYRQGKKAVTRPSYKAAIAELGKKTCDPAAKKAFDSRLLQHARETRQILSP